MPLPLQGPNAAQLQNIITASNEGTNALRSLLAETRLFAGQAQDISDRLIEAEEKGVDVSEAISNIEFSVQRIDTVIGGLTTVANQMRDSIYEAQYSVRQARETASSVEIPEPEVAHG